MGIEPIHDGNRNDTKKCRCRRSVNELLMLTAFTYDHQ